MKRTLSLLATLAFFFSITGCTSVIGTTRDKPIQDDLGSRTWGAKIDDSLIETKVAVNVNKADPRLNDESRIVVVSFNGIVLLAGQVPNASLKPIALRAASTGKIRGIKQVHDDLQVAPLAGFLARSNDSWITSKIKSFMLSRTGVPSSRIKVVTENGIVYLLGLVTHQEGKAAATVAREVSGVQRVVMLFEYID